MMIILRMEISSEEGHHLYREIELVWELVRLLCVCTTCSGFGSVKSDAIIMLISKLI